MSASLLSGASSSTCVPCADERRRNSTKAPSPRNDARLAATSSPSAMRNVQSESGLQPAATTAGAARRRRASQVASSTTITSTACSHGGKALPSVASTASAATTSNRRCSRREGAWSKPMAGADVIDDRLPVGALRPGMAHHPVPQFRILHVEQFVERLLLRFAGMRKRLVEPAAEQRIQLAGATAGAPAEATPRFHEIKPRAAPRSPPLPVGERIEVRAAPMEYRCEAGFASSPLRGED